MALWWNLENLQFDFSASVSSSLGSDSWSGSLSCADCVLSGAFAGYSSWTRWSSCFWDFYPSYSSSATPGVVVPRVPKERVCHTLFLEWLNVLYLQASGDEASVSCSVRVHRDSAHPGKYSIYYLFLFSVVAAYESGSHGFAIDSYGTPNGTMSFLGHTIPIRAYANYGGLVTGLSGSGSLTATHSFYTYP